MHAIVGSLLVDVSNTYGGQERGWEGDATADECRAKQRA